VRKLSSRTFCHFLAERKLAKLGDERWQCSKEELADALHGSPAPLQLVVLKLFLQRLALLDQQIQTLDTLVAPELKKHELFFSTVAVFDRIRCSPQLGGLQKKEK
jgi:hypothetical protein